MSEWTHAKLSELADIRFSNVDKKIGAGEARIRLCNYMDVYGNDYITADLPFMEASATPSEIERFKVEEGDVMLTKDSETPDDIGISAVVTEPIESLVCGYHLALLKPDKARIDPIYLSKQLRTSASVRYFGQRANGSTRYGLSSAAIANLEVPLAPLPQQRRIAEILGTVDGAIEQTEALIAKQQQVKAGLMHDLFTRGLTSDGQLRPRGSERKEKFGWLPQGWRIGSLSDVTSTARQPILTGPFGADLGNDDFVEEGVPVLRIGNVQTGRIDVFDLLFVTPAKAALLERYRIRTGDLLFARQGATTGRNALASKEVDGWLINYHIIRVALDHSLCAPIFIEAAFNGEMVLRQIERDKGRGTREGINSEQLRSLELPLPRDRDEQIRIADRLLAQQRAIAAETAHLAKLRQLKQGLMQALLTPPA